MERSASSGRRVSGLRLLTAALTVCVAAMHPVLAEEPVGVWTNNGPSSGWDILSVDASNSEPEIVYAGLSGPPSVAGVYRSSDGGDSWSGASSGLPAGFRAEALVVDPGDASTAFTGSFYGLFRTLDGAASWTRVDEGLPEDAYVTSLALQPGEPSALYAATYADGVFKTTDRGASWSFAGAGLPGQRASSLAVSEADASRLYVSVADPDLEGFGVWRSSDGGSSWSLTQLHRKGSLFSLAAAPTDAAVVYAGLDGAVMRTTDGGSSWSQAAGGLPEDVEVTSLAISPLSPSTVFAGTIQGAYVTTNAGANWSEVRGGMPASIWGTSIAFAGTESPRLYLGTCCSKGGVYGSTDGGSTWEASTFGLPVDVATRGIAADPSAPGVAYAASYSGTYAGVFRTGDAAGRWKPADNGIPPGTFMSDVVVHPSDPDVLLAGAYSQGVYRSTDGAKTWSKTSVADASIETLAFAPSNGNVAYAGGSVTGLGTGGSIVFRSADGGQTWTSSSSGLRPMGVISDLAVDPTNPNVVYAAGSYRGVFKSTDGGQTWTTMNLGIVSSLVSSYVVAIAVDPSSPSNVYVAVQGFPTATNGIYKSTTGGIAWVPTGLLGTAATSVVVDPANPQRVYAAVAGRVMQSADGGGSWTQLGGDVAASLLSVTKDGKRLYASGTGVSTIRLA